MIRIPNVKTNPAHICLTGCISDLFIQFGLEVNESIIFALAEASLFYYKHFDLNAERFRDGKMELFDLSMGGMRYDIPLMINNIIQYFDMKIDKKASFERAESKTFIEKYIADQLPVLAFVSRKHLGYMNTEFQNAVTHCINIVGYDWKIDQLYVSDPYIPTYPVTTYEGPLAFDEYYRSVIASRDMFKNELEFRNLAFILQEPLSGKQLSIETLVGVLKKTAAGFFSEACSSRGESTGLKGLKKFLEDVEEWLTLDHTKMQSDLFRFVHQRLSNFGGPMVTNRLLADLMAYLSDREPESTFTELYWCFTELSKSWSVIANLFGKYSFSGTFKDKGILLQRLTDVIHMEEHVYDTIKKYNWR